MNIHHDDQQHVESPRPKNGNVPPKLRKVKPNMFLARATRGSIPNVNIAGTVMSELLPVTTPTMLVRKKMMMSAISSVLVCGASIC